MNEWWQHFSELDMRALQQAESTRLGRGLTNAEACRLLNRAVAARWAEQRVIAAVARAVARGEAA